MEPLTKKVILTTVVGILAAASFSTAYSTTRNYVEAAKATHLLGGELTDLEVTEDAVFLTFHFNNTSSLDIVLLKIQFNLYANGRFLGNILMRERTLLTPGEEYLVVEAELHPIYKEELEEELEYTEKMLWYVTGGAVILLPFEEITVTISIEEYWVT